MGFWSGYFTAKALSGGSDNNGGCLLPLEIFAISGGLGMASQSWWVFGGILFGLFMVLAFKPLAMAFCILMSAAWGYCGYSIGAEFSDGMGARAVLGIIGFLIALGSHLATLDAWGNTNG